MTSEKNNQNNKFCPKCHGRTVRPVKVGTVLDDRLEVYQWTCIKCWHKTNEVFNKKVK